ncbi:MAG: hypothetical protein KBA53_12500 [Thermoclostridium sp.]|nr:hypothetical protein [Thermoclostridium sp.]
MTVLKIIAFILLGIGAFLVYGARFIAARLCKNKTDSQTQNDQTQVPDKIMPGEEDESIMQRLPSRTVLNLKMVGLVFILVGGLIIIVAFK